ncbi:hypothetical protein [Alteromonas gilva]|uniref:Uncharacterized protein n=1 Tax=Alteromonas gilva TaxID=2987522 RepID=A0ABT5L2W6_9ALTE|nr:hypothetical protein [Alteromonas gilva]MDC8831394.1 hypothetical protein [Alteromonas gilva]
MFQLVMMALGFGVGIYNLSQGLGYVSIKNSEKMDVGELNRKKRMLKFSSLPMFGIGIVYTAEFLGLW